MSQNEADRDLAGPVDEKARAFLPDDLYPVAQQLASRLLARVAEVEEKDKRIAGLEVLVAKAEAGEYHSRTLCAAAGDSAGCEACAEIRSVLGRT